MNKGKDREGTKWGENPYYRERQEFQLRKGAG
jgi:hypothetical protein